LEADGVLKTWALSIEPDCTPEQSAQRLDDHRLAYLEYEGEVAGGRGSVSRWDAGGYQIAEKEEEGRLVVYLSGARLAAAVELTATADAQLWRFRIVRTLNRTASALSR